MSVYLCAVLAAAPEERSGTPDSIASSSSAAPQPAVPPQSQAPYPGVQQGPPAGMDGKTSKIHACHVICIWTLGTVLLNPLN